MTDELVDSVLAASRALVALSARSIATAPEVTLPQFRMLVVLDSGARNLSALAEALDVAPSTAMRMVDRLVDAGLVERRVQPEDRRQTLLRLTTRGHRTVQKVTGYRRRELATVLAQVDPAQREAVGQALTAFAHAAETVWGSVATDETVATLP